MDSSLSLYALLLVLAIVGHHESAGQFSWINPDEDARSGTEITCSRNTECVSGPEYCNVDSTRSGNLQKCHFNRQSSNSVCCPLAKIIRQKRLRRTADDDEVSDYDKLLPKSVKLLQEEPECGLNTKSDGGTSEPRDWPWMAVFLEKKNWQNFCGGVLLNQRFVLTAAHCFQKYTKVNQFQVRLFEYDFTTKSDGQYLQFRASDIRIHPDYDPATQLNDIAIIRLDKLVQYKSVVRPICLPKPEMDVTDKEAVVAGWGKIQPKNNVTSDVLLQVSIPIWNHDKCVSSFSQPIFKTNLCAAAYEGGKDSCQADSGGPLLVRRDDGKWTNVGVVSWGISCGLPGKPGIYTKVSSYLKWIALKTQDIM